MPPSPVDDYVADDGRRRSSSRKRIVELDSDRDWDERSRRNHRSSVSAFIFDLLTAVLMPIAARPRSSSPKNPHR
jgi:hypothetical protein